MVEPLVVARMGSLILNWDADNNQQAVFLRCYRLMTINTLAGVDSGEFADPAWVDQLLHRFSEHYFNALDLYYQEPHSAPPVWQLAHNAARDPHISPLQNLLLGVNAHINFDLVLTLDELLKPDWRSFTESQKTMRYKDYKQVNAIIARTIDIVQDEVLDSVMPEMDLFDRLMGPLDELLVSRLITHWRDSVWNHARRILEAKSEAEILALVSQVEKAALHIGKVIAA